MGPSSRDVHRPRGGSRPVAGAPARRCRSGTGTGRTGRSERRDGSSDRTARRWPRAAARASRDPRGRPRAPPPAPLGGAAPAVASATERPAVSLQGRGFFVGGVPFGLWGALGVVGLRVLGRLPPGLGGPRLP